MIASVVYRRVEYGLDALRDTRSGLQIVVRRPAVVCFLRMANHGMVHGAQCTILVAGRICLLLEVARLGT